MSPSCGLPPTNYVNWITPSRPSKYRAIVTPELNKTGLPNKKSVDRKCPSAFPALNYHTATQARQKLRTKWGTKGFIIFQSAEYEAKLRSLANAEGLPDKTIRSVAVIGGNLDDERSGLCRQIDYLQIYSVARR